MSDLTRRSFIAGAAAIPFAVWLERHGLAQPPAAPRVRFDARSPQGQAMLKIYAQAVNKMQTATAEGDPRSWVFQWYTHAVKSSTTKSAEINRIYPSPSPQRSLAQEMWNTCQAHGPTDDENFFLPWHRMFVFFFESIVRSVSGNSTFTLPYWNYSTTDATHGVMPAQFRMQSDPTFKPLFVSKRNPGVNSGQPIDRGQPPGLLSLSSLRECTYEQRGVRQGFCLNIDANLHGNVHGLVGNGLNMGAVPWAAGDPIFWMHHSNIDRLWASWNAGGRKNLGTSAFLSKTFVFADANGQRVVAKVSDFLDIARLGYRYDRLEPVPACPPFLLGAAGTATPKPVARAKAPVSLSAAPVQMTLDTAAGPGVAPSVPFAERVRTLGTNKRLYLVVRKLRAHEQPNVLFHVYLQLPAGAQGESNESHYVGTVHFFDAVGHGGDSHGAAVAATGKENKFFSFDITDVAKKLQAEGKLGAKPSLTIVPAGQPDAEARPVIGEVSLVEQ